MRKMQAVSLAQQARIFIRARTQSYNLYKKPNSISLNILCGVLLPVWLMEKTGFEGVTLNLICEQCQTEASPIIVI